MSLYIGKDNNNNSILHTTTSTETISSMRSGILQSTAFHSDLPYAMHKVYSPLSSNVLYIPDQPYLYPSYITTYTIPTELLQLCIDKMFLCVVVDGPKVLSGANVPNAYSEGSVVWYATPSPTSSTLYVAVPSLTYKYPAVLGNFTASGTKFYSFNISQETGYIPVSFPGTDINIDEGVIGIKGIDLSSIGYLSSSSINTVDTTATTSNTLDTIQFVNDVAVSGGMSIEASSAGNEIISIGGKAIFDSAISSKYIYLGSVTGHLAYGAVTLSNSSGSTTRTITQNYLFQDGDVILWDWDSSGISSSSKVSNSIVVYRGNNTVLDRITQAHNVGEFWIYTELVGNSSGGLDLKFTYNVGSGTLNSQEYSFTFYILR